MRASLLERFARLIDRHVPAPQHRPDLGPCWLWLGDTRNGYGRIWREGRSASTHRLAWELANRREPDRLVLHACDRKRCVNPDHLVLGFQLDNMADMVRKGRSLRGERHNCAKLTVEQVDEIRRRRADGMSQADLAAAFRVSRSAICLIVNQREWTEIRGARPGRAMGERHGGAKLKREDVIEIRRACGGGESQREIAARFGVNQVTVSAIQRRKTWKDVA